MTTSACALNVKHASKSFGINRALSEVSLRIDHSGVIAVLGQNGAGKTTLIRAACGLLELDHGTSTVFGKASTQRVARERLGIMLQDSDLPDLLTAREMVELFASYYPAPLTVSNTLDLADIGEFAHKRYKHLSGGQKRRVQFALAIVGNPDLVFLDEPTTGLDPDARRALWSVVRSFASEGKTIILTTHYLEEADTLADRIVIMRDGRIVANAPADEIRAVLGGSVIRCHTTMALHKLQVLSCVTRVATSGRVSEIHTSDVVTTLRHLLEPDNHVADLSVSRPNLEDVFAQEYS